MGGPLVCRKRLVFALWGAGFDAAVTTRFVSDLRGEGFPVKIVGLAGRFVPGNRGIAIGIDLTLDEALPLAGEVGCLILACNARVLQEAENDPRLAHLYEQVWKANSSFILRDMSALHGSWLGRWAERTNLYLYGSDSLSVCIGAMVSRT